MRLSNHQPGDVVGLFSDGSQDSYRIEAIQSDGYYVLRSLTYPNKWSICAASHRTTEAKK